MLAAHATPARKIGEKMALPYPVTFTVTDGEGKKSSGQFYIDSAQTIANASTEAEGLLADIAPLLTGIITEASLAVPLDVSALAGTPNVQSNIKYKFRLVMTSAEGHTTILSMPAADQSKVVDGSNILDVADADVAALLAGVISRPLVTSHDEPVTAVSKHYEVFGR